MMRARFALGVVVAVVIGVAAGCGGQASLRSEATTSVASDEGVAPTGGAVREAAARWLSSVGLDSYRVGEVSRFERGGYATIEDDGGTPAFELTVDAVAGWVWFEPGPSMIWNTRYGMASPFMRDVMARAGQSMPGWMHGPAAGSWDWQEWDGCFGYQGSCWEGGHGSMMRPRMVAPGGGMMGEWATPTAAGSGPVTTHGDAMAAAAAWLAASHRGERAVRAIEFPGYFTVFTERAGSPSGMLSVNGLLGDLWYEGWLGQSLDPTA